MKPTPFKSLLVIALVLATGGLAAAQSNNVPGSTAYADFSRFITQRNIFDPNRYPRSSGSRPVTYRPRATRSTPTFSLVGTMSYQKGMFAFFDGNNSDLRQALTVSGGIAGYTVSEITATGVKLESADKKQTVTLKIGDLMRQDGKDWVLAGPGELPAGTTDNGATGTGGAEAAASAAPSSASAPNDILKKLMEKREKELK